MSNRWSGIDEVVAVAETGSFVAAAKRLGSSTSKVSRVVSAFEARLGAALFHRTTRVVTLTDSGRILAEQLKRIVLERDEALSILDVGGEPNGLLRITCPTSLGERFVAPIVQRYLTQYTRLSVDLDLSNHIVDLVGEGFDLAIRTGTMPDSRLIRRQVASRRLITCASPDYLDRMGSPAKIDDLAGHACIVGSAEVWRFQIDGDVASYRPRGRLHCNSGAAVTQAALAGMGICHLPEFYVNRAISLGNLVPVLEHLEREHEPIWAVYPQRRHLLPKVQKLVEFLGRDLGPVLKAG